MAEKEPKNLFELRRNCYKNMKNLVTEWSDEAKQAQKTLSAKLGQEELFEHISHRNEKIISHLDSFNEKLFILFFDAENSHYMSIASLAALRSKDPRTPIGACIVDTNKKIVGIGYNSMPYTPFCDNDSIEVFGWGRRDGLKSSSKYQQEDTKYPYVCHAAVNAIANRTIPDLTNCTIYLTQFPDEDCAHLIAQSGIKELKYQRNMKRGNKDHEMNAKRILQLGRVSIEEFNPKTEITWKIKRLKQNNTIGKPNRVYIANEIRICELEERVLALCQDQSTMILNGEKVFAINTEIKSPKVKTMTIVRKTDLTVSSCIVPQSNEEYQVINLNLTNRLDTGKDDENSGKADPEDILSWEEFFMALAMLECAYSNDGDKSPIVKVGVCLVNTSKQIIAIGGSSAENRPEVLGEGSGFAWTTSGPSSDPYAQHAEYKTIATYKGVESIKGCTLYVTKSPCNICAKLIAQSGIVEVVYKDELEDKYNSFKQTRKIFDKCSIGLRQFENIVKLQFKEAKTPDPSLKRKSICFECDKFKKDGDMWSCTLELNYDNSNARNKLPDMDKCTLSLDSVDIFSKTKLQGGDFELPHMNGIVFNKSENEVCKWHHFVKKYNGNVIQPGDVLCKVKSHLVTSETETTAILLDHTSIVFDIFVTHAVNSV